MLADLALTISPKSLRDICIRLDSQRERVPAEWELLVAAGLNAMGVLRYEDSFGGQTRPDIHFDSGEGLKFVADVKCISDGESISDDFVKRLCAENARLAKAGVKGKISAAIGVILDGDRHRLALPYAHKLPGKIFKSVGFGRFVAAILRSTQTSHRHTIRCEGVEVAFVFSPGSGLMAIRHHPVGVPQSINDNSLIGALNEKRSQIAKSGWRGTTGIFFCDGGSATFDPMSPGPGLDGVLHGYLFEIPHLTLSPS